MDQIKIGICIAQMRKEQSLTQRKLADLLGISDKTVSKWETGNGLPEVSLMMPLCETLGISVNELLSGERLSAYVAGPHGIRKRRLRCPACGEVGWCRKRITR